MEACGCDEYDILSRGEESTRLRHLVPVFAVCGDGKGHCGNAEDDGARDEGVVSPVCGLCIPSTGRGPDVLGETAPRSVKCITFGVILGCD